MVTVGGDAPSTGGGIDKRTLLVGALVIGGSIGAFMLVARKTSKPSDSAEDKAQTDVPQSSLTLAYQNLAEQLLGFRGDVSVANANIAQGEQDILSAIGNESAARMSSNQSMMAAIWQTFARASDPTLSWDYLMNQNPYLDHSQVYTAPGQTQQSGTSSEDVPTSTVGRQTTNPGAGGATPRDAIMAAFGAEDDAHYYLARMSSGPVRQLSSRTY